MAGESTKSYRRDDVRARTSGAEVQIAGADEDAQRGQASATKWQQAVDAGYDPVDYGYNPNTGQYVGQTNARRQAAEAEAAKKKSELEQEEANKRAMLNAGLTADGKARAPKAGQTTQRQFAAAPRAAFKIGEDGKPEWTGGYIDGRIGGEVMREERMKAEEAFKKGKGPQPFGPSKSDRDYDAYLAAMDKYNASKNPTPTDPTTDLDGVDDSVTPPPTPTEPTPTEPTPAEPTPTEPTSTETKPTDTKSANDANYRNPAADLFRGVNTYTKTYKTMYDPLTKVVDAADKTTLRLSTEADEAIKHADEMLAASQTLADRSDEAAKIATQTQKTYEATQAGKGLAKKGLQAGAAANQAEAAFQASQKGAEIANAALGREAKAAADLAADVAKNSKFLPRAIAGTSAVVNSTPFKKFNTGLSYLAAAFDTYDSVKSAGGAVTDAIQGKEYDYNTADAAAMKKEIEAVDGALDTAKFIGAQTYKMTPAVFGGGGETVSTAKAMQDVAIGSSLEGKGAEGDIQASNLKTQLLQRQAKGEQAYREALLLPEVGRAMTDQEKKQAMAKTLRGMKPAERTKVLDQARTEMFVDQMLEADPALLEKYVKAGEAESEAIREELRNKASEQTKKYFEGRKKMIEFR